MPDFLLHEKTVEDPDFQNELTLVGFSEHVDSPIAFLQGVIRKRDAVNWDTSNFFVLIQMKDEKDTQKRFTKT